MMKLSGAIRSKVTHALAEAGWEERLVVWRDSVIVRWMHKSRTRPRRHGAEIGQEAGKGGDGDEEEGERM
jgi:hypothetical protein